MADINLEKKRSTPIWPWILGLLALLVIGWLIVEAMDRDDRDVATTTSTAAADPITAPAPAGAPVSGTQASAATMPAGLQEYTSRCQTEEGAQPDAIGQDHEYTTRCFDLLASSMSAIASQRQADVNLTQQIETVQQQVNSMRQSDPASLEHSNSTREAATASAEALSSMQQAFGTAGDEAESAVRSARDAAQQIEASEALLEQREELKTFFREAGNALQALSASGAAA